MLESQFSGPLLLVGPPVEGTRTAGFDTRTLNILESRENMQERCLCVQVSRVGL